MKRKILLTILAFAHLFASAPSSGHWDQDFRDLYDKLSYQNIMNIDEAALGFKIYNLSDLRAFGQGTSASFQILVKGVKPFRIFNTAVYIQDLSGDLKSRFLALPHMPSDIRESTDNLCVHVFAYAAEGFGKKGNPLFIYVTRLVFEGEEIFSLYREDFYYQANLIDYIETFSLLSVFFAPLEKNIYTFNIHYKLANIGIIKSQGMLGVMYYTGEGVGKDLKQAARYFQMAADQGDKDAHNNLILIDPGYLTLTSIYIKAAVCIVFYNFKGKLGAIYEMYRNGKDVQKKLKQDGKDVQKKLKQD